MLIKWPCIRNIACQKGPKTARSLLSQNSAGLLPCNEWLFHRTGNVAGLIPSADLRANHTHFDVKEKHLFLARLYEDFSGTSRIQCLPKSKGPHLLRLVGKGPSPGMWLFCFAT